MLTEASKDWLIDVAADLENDPPKQATPTRTIFRVPQQLREISPQSYDSKFFSFGLYGVNTSNDSIRDPYRKDFARIFRKVVGNKAWAEICTTVVGTSAKEWEEHYDDLDLVPQTPADPEDDRARDRAIVTHLALDAVFMACFIKACHALVCKQHCFDVKDMDLHEVMMREGFHNKLNLIRLDMIKFENQIPLRLVEKAFGMMPVEERHVNEQGDESSGELSFTERVAHFVDLIYCNLPGYKPRKDFLAAQRKFNFSEHKHLLHCLYSVVCYKEGKPAQGSSKTRGNGAAAGNKPPPPASAREGNVGADRAVAGGQAMPDGSPHQESLEGNDGAAAVQGPTPGMNLSPETRGRSSDAKGPEEPNRGVAIQEPRQQNRGVVIQEPRNQSEITTPRINGQKNENRGKGKAKVSDADTAHRGVVSGHAGQRRTPLREGGQTPGSDVGSSECTVSPQTSFSAPTPTTPSDRNSGSASTTQEGSTQQPPPTAARESRNGEAAAMASNQQTQPQPHPPSTLQMTVRSQTQQSDGDSAQTSQQQPITGSTDNPAGEPSQKQRPIADSAVEEIQSQQQLSAADNTAVETPPDRPPGGTPQKPAGDHNSKGHAKKHIHSLLIPTVTQLEEAGIKVSVGRNNATKRITDVHFKRSKFFRCFGTLYLPAFNVYDETETLFRNLITYEYVVERGNILVSYVHLMDNLIDTEQDVKLLIERGVLTNNSVGSNEVPVKMWNTMLRGVVIHDLSPEYREVFDQVALHSRTRTNKLVAEFRKLYLRKPWHFGGAILLLITVIFTVVGTTYTTLTYYYGNKNKA